MAASTPCSDPLVSDICNTNPGVGEGRSRPAQPGREFLFLGDTSSARLGQNGRDSALQEFSSAHLIENTDQLYAMRLQSRGMQ
jgi:hypothetical protein